MYMYSPFTFQNCHVQILLSYKHILGLLHLPDDNGRTPLMLAAENGHLE